MNMTPVSSTSDGPRERILATAGQLFFRYGYRAIGVNRLIAESGVAKASFYYHFPTKEQLLLAWLDQRGDRWLSIFKERIERASSLEERIRAMYSMWYDQLGEEGWRGCSFVNIAAEFSDETSLARARVRKHKLQVRNYIASDVLSECRVVVLGEEFEMLVDTVFSLFDGAIVQAQNLMSQTPLLTAEKSTLRFIYLTLGDEDEQVPGA